MAALHHQHMRPSSMSANSVTQLEFHQAMTDFKIMFPAMDADVIECVLRSNNGAVDATIDQLLQMAADLEKANPQPQPFMSSSSSAVTSNRRPEVDQRNQLISLDDDEDDERPITAIPASILSQTPPPSYQQAVPFTGTSASTDQTPGISSGARVKDCNKSGATAGDILTRKVSNNSLRARFKWTPPLIGPLPDSFLRFPDPSLHRLHAMHYNRSTGSTTQSMGRRNHSHAVDTRLNNSRPVSVLSATLLQQKMQENELKRQQSTHDDPETSQMLDDERLAILLQNEEFVRELRNNQEFMSQLQRDAASRRASGDERDGGTGASGGSSSNFSDAAFREMLKNMSKVSRKKFAQVAGMFSRRRRNRSDASSGPVSSPTHRHMSKDHLLSAGSRDDEYRALENDSSDSEDRHSPYWTEQPATRRDDDPYFVGIHSPMRSNKRDSGDPGFRL